ncbi:MAG TPA: glucose-6-phosphate dehydrogenase assembly protein OpcA [Acidimicrobiales bacterium]|nr:glucose-6-phosphate dehydrogenase assembly protein OpcA [Acidimicrobiales bacterium]
MANAVATTTTTDQPLSVWEGDGVTISEVTEELVRLRRGQPETATRTACVTLVVVGEDEEEAKAATSAMHRLGARHPGRTIVLVPEPEAERGIDARVALHRSQIEGHPVWSEDIRLRVRGPAARHLDSLIEPLTLPELPLCVWFVAAAPAVHDPLVRTADAVIVDLRQIPGAAGDPGPALARLTKLAAERTLVDLSWTRLTPWRDLLAGMFEPAPYRPFLEAVHAVEVCGLPGPRHLLGGWIASRLRLPSFAVQLRQEDHVSVVIAATTEGHSGRFSVERRAGEHLVRARAEADGAPVNEMVLALPTDTLPWSLGVALSRPYRDPVYEESLAAAALLARR